MVHVEQFVPRVVGVEVGTKTFVEATSFELLGASHNGVTMPTNGQRIECDQTRGSVIVRRRRCLMSSLHFARVPLGRTRKLRVVGTFHLETSVNGRDGHLRWEDEMLQVTEVNGYAVQVVGVALLRLRLKQG